MGKGSLGFDLKRENKPPKRLGAPAINPAVIGSIQHLKYLRRSGVNRSGVQEVVRFRLLYPPQRGQKPSQLYLHEHPTCKEEDK